MDSSPETLIPHLPGPEGGDPVLVGQIASLTGINPGGVANYRGALLAARRVNNAGGLMGRSLQLIVEDDESTPDGAERAFERLTARGVAAIVGTSYSNANLQLIPLIEASGVPYVSTGAADSQVEPVRDMLFMTPPTGQAVAEQMLRYLRDNDITRVFVLVDEDSAFARNGWAKQQLLLSRFGVEVIGFHGCRHSTEDFSDLRDKVQAVAPDALVCWVTGPPAVRFARHLRGGGYDLPVVMGHGAATPEVAAELGTADQVVVASSLAIVAQDLPESTVRDEALALVDPFAREYGLMPSQFAVDGYAALRVIAAAIEAAGTAEPRRVQQALETLSVMTPSGYYRFSPTDHAGLSVDNVAMATVRDSTLRLIEWSASTLRGSLGSK